MYYRLYFLNQDDHIENGLDLEGADDETAIRLAEDQADGRAMELWRGAKRVKQFGVDAIARTPLRDQHP